MLQFNLRFCHKPDQGMYIVQIMAQLAAANELQRAATRILDVRDAARFEAGHAAGAYNIPWDELRDRGFEMPSRATKLLVHCDAPFVAEVRAWFATRSERCRWNVVGVSAGGGPERGPAPAGRFLFDASPLLAASADLLPRSGRALDVGAGSGRDAATLFRFGLRVVALDRDAAALARFERLCARQGYRAEAVRATLEKAGDVADAAPGPFDVVTVARFLHRPTLLELGDALAPGGLLLYHTFMEGCAHPTDPAVLLRPGELRAAFPDLDILRDDVAEIDDGRRLSMFVARRPD